ncbi:hypothetical protein C2S51_034312 [Perilla frutescens var. frutescens]|nr:hypothetical protein C2S51_034312 [Perilla frutescens var. frutescens]
MLRIASAKDVPSAFRALAAPRVLSLPITNAFDVSTPNPNPNPNPNPRPLLSRRYFSVQSKHRELLTALDSEIKIMQLMPLRPAAPATFPFQIEHHFYDSQITLSRELDGEQIRIRVLDVEIENQNDEDDTDSNSDGDSDSDEDSDSTSDSDEESSARSVPLRVEIFKENGKSMKFVATASADEILIERLSTKADDGTVICSQLYIKPESELQYAFRDFLGVRGVEKSIGGFLYDYMVWKSKLPQSYRSKTVEDYSAEAAKFDQENVETLKKLKQVIEDWCLMAPEIIY